MRYIRNSLGRGALRCLALLALCLAEQTSAQWVGRWTGWFQRSTGVENDLNGISRVSRYCPGDIVVGQKAFSQFETTFTVCLPKLRAQHNTIGHH
eukprot:1179081-Prorocentrum_minimum.AAC.3